MAETGLLPGTELVALTQTQFDTAVAAGTALVGGVEVRFKSLLHESVLETAGVIGASFRISVEDDQQTYLNVKTPNGWFRVRLQKVL